MQRARRAATFMGIGAVLTGVVANVGPSFAAAQAKPGTINKQYAGTHITVLLPPWGQMPASALKKFTKETGITVTMENMAWDSIHQKIVTSEAAHVAPADVTEVDWSWAGQFSQSGWYTPLNQYLPKKEITNSVVGSIFTHNGQLLAMPYSLDYRVTILDWTIFKKAGIKKVPTNWSELLADAKQIKAKHAMQYPFAVPMSVTEGSSTPWYMLIKSAGGELFDNKWNPLFTSPTSAGAKALNFEKTLYDDKLVPPGETSLTDQQNGDLFKAGKAAILLASGPGGLPGLLDEKQSKIAHHQLVMISPPGPKGHETGTFGLPEALGVPTLSKHQGAAAMFINWWMQTPQLITAYENGNMGDLPTEKYALQALNKEHKLVDGGAVLKSIAHVKPLFPQGTPSWYPQFSNDVASMIQSVVNGKAQPAAALQTLASETKAILQGP